MHRGGQGRTAIAWLLSSDVFPSALSTCTVSQVQVRASVCQQHGYHLPVHYFFEILQYRNRLSTAGEGTANSSEGI